MCTPCRWQSRSNASTSARSRLIVMGWVIITASWRPVVIRKDVLSAQLAEVGLAEAGKVPSSVTS